MQFNNNHENTLINELNTIKKRIVNDCDSKSNDLNVSINKVLTENNNLIVKHNNIHIFKENERRIKSINNEIKHLKSFIVGFDKRMCTIKKTRKKNIRFILYNKIISDAHNINSAFVLNEINKKTTSELNYHICKTCKTKLIETVDSKQLCVECGVVNDTLDPGTDYVNDIIGKIKNTTYNRNELYRRYLTQYHESKKNPPQFIINIIYKHMTKVHIGSNCKIKQTPVTNILRKEKLHKWIPYACRISKFMNNEFIVKLSTQLIDKLVERFKKITEVVNKQGFKNRTKILNFEYLTKQFLLMDGQDDLAQWFMCHKSKKILMPADENLRKCCDILKETDCFNWRYFKNC